MNIQELQETSFQKVLKGALGALPLVIAYFSCSLPFAIMATQSGMPGWAVVLMSFIVYAGSAQFVGVQLLLAGAGYLEVFLATFFINSRYLLMSTALASKLPHLSPSLLYYTAYSTTDETFGVVMSKSMKEDEKLCPYSSLGTNIAGHIIWGTATVCGVLIAPKLTGFSASSVILPIMFGVLVGLQIKDFRIDLLLAATAMILTFVFSLFFHGMIPFISATLIVPLIGVLLTKRGKK